MLRIPLRTLLVGTALLVLPAAAQTSVAASLLAGIISVGELSTSDGPTTPNTTIPEKMQPQENGTTGSGEHSNSLSDELDRSGGVLSPPADIDPGLARPTPDVGTTRIIPPPGSPGGDPTVRPK